MNAEDMPLLVESCGDALYGFCRKLARSKDDADELFQQTFLRAMELCYKIDMRQNPQSYLFGIAVRIWRSIYRRNQRRARIAPQEPLDGGAYAPTVASAQDEAQRRMDAERLVSLSDELPEKLRIVLYMFYGSSFSVAEISAALKLPQGTVKSRLFKARVLIKKGLVADGYEFSE